PTAIFILYLARDLGVDPPARAHPFDRRRRRAPRRALRLRHRSPSWHRTVVHPGRGSRNDRPRIPRAPLRIARGYGRDNRGDAVRTVLWRLALQCERPELAPGPDPWPSARAGERELPFPRVGHWAVRRPSRRDARRRARPARRAAGSRARLPHGLPDNRPLTTPAHPHGTELGAGAGHVLARDETPAIPFGSSLGCTEKRLRA